MKTTLLVVGKVQSPFAEADAHYRKMLSRHQPVEVIEVRDERDLEGRIPDGAHVRRPRPRGRGTRLPGLGEWLRSAGSTPGTSAS